MASLPNNTKATLISARRHRDVPAAIDPWTKTT